MIQVKHFSVALLYLNKDDKAEICLCNGIFHDINEDEAFKQACSEYEKKNNFLKNWILANKNIIEFTVSWEHADKHKI